MARSIEEIKKMMTDLFIGDETIQQAYQLTPGKTFEQEFSKASIESILFYCVAFCTNFLERLFDLFRSDSETYIANMKPHTVRWYATKGLAYMHGVPLLPDSDVFDTTGLTDEQITTAKVVQYCSCNETYNQNNRLILRIKLAKEAAGVLGPLTDVQLDGVREYFARVKDAGVPMLIESNVPDRLKMKWMVYYDPLILDNEGNRIDGNGTGVVRAAIKNYLTKLPFNGLYAIQKHEDYVQLVPGVKLCPVQLAQRKIFAYDWQYINVSVVPDAGYFKFYDEGDLEIVYIMQNEIV